MASLFTFDPDPPRVASPWSTPRSVTPQKPSSSAGTAATLKANAIATSGLTPRAVLETDSSVTKLDAEPQEGPTEYKLHLLLRPRRSFTHISTARHVAGSHRTALGIPTARIVPEVAGGAHTPPKSTSSQSRQHRLEQLTTQLLWRLQQSSPYHSTSANELVVPQLPEATPQLKTQPLAKVLPGLEESQGALYEIGVADDGTFVGLAEDEMEESLTNLRAMAASLGCSVKVLRMIPVGECTWSDDADENPRTGTLWVAEALVKPEVAGSGTPSPTAQLDPMGLEDGKQATEQLRLSLTGATMSGKSSLLGSLSTATLDNGRGKSRLSLLKHRHEIVSGMTSSVTQELIGYTVGDESGDLNVINYASGNIDSWIDIHSACQGGRLVFLSDSAGHPRYRRTAVRGLMGWAPHWTLLCMPADNDEDTSGKVGSTPSTEEMLGSAVADVDLSEAHLDLCLNLKMPLMVVVTKMDLASKTGLKQTLNKLLSTLKAAGRTPRLMSDSITITEEDLHTVPATDVDIARTVADELAKDSLATVPIVLTSAVKGNGIRKLHALLHEIQGPESTSESQLTALYHVEDVYKLNLGSNTGAANAGISIISGHLRYGVLHLGDELLLGPFHIDHAAEDSDSSGSSPKPDQLTASRSFPGTLHRHLDLASRLDPATRAQEWRRVRITSIRNLRLPVRTLRAGQVGTLGILPLSHLPNSTNSPPTTTLPATAHQTRIRKGMVLAAGMAAPPSYNSFVARFAKAAVRNLIVGSLVVTYISSVRASAKVIAIAIDEDGEERTARSCTSREDDAADDPFGFDDEDDQPSGSDLDDAADCQATLVTFQFVATREFLEPGAQVLVMEGGGGRVHGRRGLVGLEGFVGSVVQGFG
ncbi:hypothetical protein IWZ00DRAFT_526246 [Phyllosticta capitalensis]